MSRFVWNNATVVVVPITLSLLALAGSGCNEQPAPPRIEPEPRSIQDSMHPAPEEGEGIAEPLGGASAVGDGEGIVPPIDRPPTAAEEEAAEDTPVLSEQPAEPDPE